MLAMKLNPLSLHTTFFFLWSKYIENFTRFRFVSFRLISFRFVRFRFVAFRFYFVSHFTGTQLNKPQLTKNKQQHFIGIRVFDSRLYLDISRSFKWIESFIFRYCKVFQLSQMFTWGLSDLLLLAVDSLVVFVFRNTF